MREVLSISALNRYVKNLISDDLFLNYVEVKGEIINLKRYANAIYFTLKEGDIARISAVSFNLNAFPSSLKDGDEVLAKGRVSVYEKSGSYQIVCHEVNYYGLGAKLVALAALKVKLEKMGLFSAEKKKPLPKFPRVIGIITPKDSAAQSDLLTNINRRYPLVTIKLINATFQGENAPTSLIKAFNTLNNEDIDVLIIARGGGSSDDLWAFNDEKLILALSQKKMPLISAIGHEIDTTLVDYLADVRASTPTGAAELAVPDQNEVRQDTTNLEIRLNNAFLSKYNVLSAALLNLTSRPVLTNFNAVITNLQTILQNDTTRLSAYIGNIINKYTLAHEALKEKQKTLILLKHAYYREELGKSTSALMSLNPRNILQRGYAFISRDEEIITSSKALNTKDNIKIQFNDGTVNATITKGEDDE